MMAISPDLTLAERTRLNAAARRLLLIILVMLGLLSLASSAERVEHERAGRSPWAFRR